LSTKSFSGPESVNWLGTQYEIILSKQASGGTMSIVSAEAPVDSGPPLHVHMDADETFVMLTGRAEFMLHGARSVVSAGETVFVPRGHEHTFRVLVPKPSRHLVILTPGGFEGFFMEMGRDQLAIPADMEEITRCAARYHLTFTGPPLQAA